MAKNCAAARDGLRLRLIRSGMGAIMLAVARTLSVLSIVLTAACAIVAIGAGCFNFVHLGLKVVLVYHGLFFSLGVATGLFALVIAIARTVWGEKGGNAQVVLVSAVSLLLLVAVSLFVFMEPPHGGESACYSIKRKLMGDNPPDGLHEFSIEHR